MRLGSRVESDRSRTWRDESKQTNGTKTDGRYGLELMSFHISLPFTRQSSLSLSSLCPIYHTSLSGVVYYINSMHVHTWRTFPNLSEPLYTSLNEGERRIEMGEKKRENGIKNMNQQLKTPPNPRLTFSFLWQQTVLDGRIDARVPRRS